MNNKEAIQEAETFRRYFRDGILEFTDTAYKLTIGDSKEGTKHSTQSTLDQIASDMVKAERTHDNKTHAGLARHYLRFVEAGRARKAIVDGASLLPALRRCEQSNAELLNDNRKLSTELSKFRPKVDKVER